MRPHPVIRAYLAGIAVPTVFLFIAMLVYVLLRFVEAPSFAFIFDRPGGPLERVIVFPLAFVPNLWGAWNVLHLLMRRRVPLSLGAHGAMLPLLLVPAGVVIARVLGAFTIQLGAALLFAPIGMAIYYVVWKHAVGFLNAELGIT